MPTRQEKWAQHKKTFAPILTGKSCFCNTYGALRDSVPQLICPWCLGTGCCEIRVSWPCCWWSYQTPGERLKMLQRRNGAALLCHLCPSCPSPKSRITMVICYLTKGTWQAGLFKVTNQPHQVFWLQQMKQLKSGEQNANKPAWYCILSHMEKLLESSNFQVFTSWQTHSI